MLCRLATVLLVCLLGLLWLSSRKQSTVEPLDITELTDSVDTRQAEIRALDSMYTEASARLARAEQQLVSYQTNADVLADSLRKVLEAATADIFETYVAARDSTERAYTELVSAQAERISILERQVALRDSTIADLWASLETVQTNYARLEYARQSLASELRRTQQNLRWRELESWTWRVGSVIVIGMAVLGS